jgi:hypothetical protein
MPVAHRRDDLRMRMAEHRTHLARGQVQHTPAGGIAEKRAFGPHRHEVDELAAVFEQVPPRALPKRKRCSFKVVERWAAS